MRAEILLAALVLAGASATARAEPHPCSSDALARAPRLLALHADDNQSPAAEGGILLPLNGAVGEEVRLLPAIKALKGDGRFDVLEVDGFIYKATYRMRFIYAQIPGSCVLMGQEIIEISDPY
ncbi:MAG: hypothetical protein HXY22_09760 [Alphaproteobacteria bacterium]|nr:hypothetical protein [Alphaproteobacteria bacterium]